ncbi:hypothetical protein ACFL1H_06155 [Nanoarchaeota archaeon]
MIINQNKTNTLNLILYNYKQKYQIIEMLAFSIIAFALPFMLAHPQWLVGTIVNFMLFRAAIHMKGYQLLPIILLPSIGVFSAGLIFGSLTNYLLIFIPFIWLANTTYILSYKYFGLKKKLNFYPALIISVLAKSALLFSVALILVYLFNFPIVFLTVMGLIQVITATLGGLLAFYSVKAQNLFKN